MTSELHDSYFCLMTIKHAIPKIEWAIKLLYNLVKTGSQSWRSDELETRCGRESYTQLKGPSGPPMEFRDPLVTRCGRESPHTAEWASGPPVEQPWRTRKTTLMAIRVVVNILQFCLVSNSLSQ